jgi:hypothetical protein
MGQPLLAPAAARLPNGAGPDNTSGQGFAWRLADLGEPVLLEIVLGVVLALLCVAGIFLWIRRARANARTIGAPGGEPDRLFRGGVMGRHIITSGSLARLEFFDWGVRLRGTVVSSWVVPTWEARYDQLAMAELVALPTSRITVWLRLRDEGGAIGFLTEESRDILTLLQDHGVPVDRSLTQIRRVDELYK